MISLAVAAFLAGLLAGFLLGAEWDALLSRLASSSARRTPVNKPPHLPGSEGGYPRPFLVGRSPSLPTSPAGGAELQAAPPRGGSRCGAPLHYDGRRPRSR